MSSQSNQAPELKRADTSEVPMTGEDRFAEVPARRWSRAVAKVTAEHVTAGSTSISRFPLR
jgi:hypothetical protein